VSDPPSAQIIAFPVAARAQANADAERLAKALAGLDAALAEQRVAVAAWRDSLAALKRSTGGLADSLGRFQAGLETLDADVSALNGRARALERWADDAIAQVGAVPASAVPQRPETAAPPDVRSGSAR
jgi:septal ring factor EnvC (AmiA/AmiB activator)